MKKSILTLFLALVALTLGYSQNIEMKKVFGGYQYTQDGKILTMAAMVKAMESNPEALNFMKKAKSNTTLASVLGAIGGALIGIPVGTALGGGEPNWTFAGVGAGFILIGIPVASSANTNAKNAVELYNASLKTTSYWTKPELKIFVRGNEVGLSASF